MPFFWYLDPHMFAANMNLLVLIEGDSGHREHHLIERRRFALWQFIDIAALSEYRFAPEREMPF